MPPPPPPPPPPPDDRHDVTDEPATLSDQDVAILHSIITTAQQLPQAARFPFRALFDAYHTVLRDRGLDPDYDPIYFRFLLRVGGVPGEAPLYEKFEVLLADMGIRIEFDGDEDTQPSWESEKDEPPFPATASPSQASSAESSSTTSPPPRPRPARGRPARGRPARAISVSRSSRSPSKRLPSPPERFGRAPARRAATGASDRTMSIDRLGFSHDESMQENRFRSRHRLPSTSPRSTTRGRSAGSRDGGRQRSSSDDDFHRRLARAWARHAAAPAEVNDRIDPRSRPVPGATQAGPPPLSRPSDAQMSLDAASLYRHHESRLVRGCFRQWRSRCDQILFESRVLHERARRHDRDTLMRQAWDTWRLRLRQRREREATARYFSALERRATKARNLYLLTKAFTHWAQSAADEVERTRLARRHMLRTKYFKAWRAITEANAQKVRQHRLKQALDRWRSRTLATLVDAREATLVYQRNSIKDRFWHWFWTFCERRAPDWHAGRTKRAFFGRWIGAVQERREREGWIEGVRRADLLKKMFSRWRRRSADAAAQAQAAERFRQRSLLQRSLTSVSVQARLAPAAAAVAERVDERLVRTALQALVHRTRAELEAAQICRLRLQRNAWTAWNDRLRAQSLAARIDERLALQALYRWTLAERAMLLRRLGDERLKRQAMAALLDRCRTQRHRLAQAEAAVRARAEQRQLRAVVGRWRLQLQLHRRREALALEFHAPGLVQDAWQQWRGRAVRQQQLERDADRARYYVLATHTFARWQQALLRSRRDKRRAAYAQVRRRVKMDCARAALASWRQRNAQRAALEHEAGQLAQNRLLVLAMELLDRWRARREDVAEMGEQALVRQRTQAQQRCLELWQARLEEERGRDRQATYQAKMRVLNVAAGLLRQLGMQAFQRSNHERSAEHLRARNDKKHVRNMLRYWHERSLHRRSALVASGGLGTEPEAEATDAEPDPGPGDPGGQLEAVGRATQRAEDWTAFDEGLVGADWLSAADSPGVVGASAAAATPAPVPGYLSTPSKRAARAKALVRLSTTPAATPRMTPFSQRLSGQAEAGSARRPTPGLGQSLLGRRRAGRWPAEGDSRAGDRPWGGDG